MEPGSVSGCRPHGGFVGESQGRGNAVDFLCFEDVERVIASQAQGHHVAILSMDQQGLEAAARGDSEKLGQCRDGVLPRRIDGGHL